MRITELDANEVVVCNTGTVRKTEQRILIGRRLPAVLHRDS